MVGVRNEILHEGQEVNLDIVQSIAENRLSDVKRFTERGRTTNGVRTPDA